MFQNPETFSIFYVNLQLFLRNNRRYLIEDEIEATSGPNNNKTPNIVSPK